MPREAAPRSRIAIREHFPTTRGLGEARTVGEKGPENAGPINAMVISPRVMSRFGANTLAPHRQLGRPPRPPVQCAAICLRPAPESRTRSRPGPARLVISRPRREESFRP